jgi:hypothetical protein
LNVFCTFFFWFIVNIVIALRKEHSHFHCVLLWLGHPASPGETLEAQRRNRMKAASSFQKGGVERGGSA